MKTEQSNAIEERKGTGRVRIELSGGGNETCAKGTEIASTTTTSDSSLVLETAEAEKDDCCEDGCDDENTLVAFALKTSNQKENYITTSSCSSRFEIHAQLQEAQVRVHGAKYKANSKKELLEVLSQPSVVEGMTVRQIINIVQWRRCVRRDKILRQIKRKKPKDAPKRPLSGYNVFFKEERRRILDADKPGMDFRNIAKTVGSRWRALSNEEKSRYKEMAAPDMDRYRVEMKEYQEKNAGKPRPEVTQKQIRAMIKKNKKKERENWNKAKYSELPTSSTTVCDRSILAAATSPRSGISGNAGSEFLLRGG